MTVADPIENTMFGFFKSNKKKPVPEFKTLRDSPLKDKYFARKATWGWMNKEMIYIIDPHSPRLITMDPWPQQVFLHADGQKTVEEFVYHVTDQYGRRERIPADLDEMILELVQEHANDYRIIELADSPIELPDEYLRSISEREGNKTE